MAGGGRRKECKAIERELELAGGYGKY